VEAAHGDEAPLVVDPFAGGGSIPLEALRLGCEAFASDLNPVACLILKVMLEDIPRHGAKLAEELRQVGAEIKKQAETELAQYYPPDPDGATPIAYLWARTVRCESPHCGAEIPLIRSFWLCKKANRLRALRYEVKRPNGKPAFIQFEVFTPKSEKQVPAGIVSLGNATCPACEHVLPIERVRVQLRETRGGADTIFDKHDHRIGGARLLAVVALKDNVSGRQYRTGADRDYEPARKALEALEKLEKQKLSNGLSRTPNEPIPHERVWKNNPIRVHHYGMACWSDLFTARQRLALTRISSLVSSLPNGSEISESTQRGLAMSVSRLADKNASLALWNQVGEKIEHVFGRQALSMIWDFAEVAIFSDSTGNFQSGVDLIREVVEEWPRTLTVTGQVQLADACENPLPDDAADVWFTDPPYYDAVPYASLSDFFFVWLNRVLPRSSLLSDPFDPENKLVPKTREIVLDEVKQFDGKMKDSSFFEARMALAFAEGRRVTQNDGIGSVIFAHKTTEGWEALLNGIVRGGWVVTGSWPVATERPGRLRSQNSAALATSVHPVSYTHLTLPTICSV